jgi:3-methyladenine DNA glycosylase AlkD
MDRVVNEIIATMESLGSQRQIKYTANICTTSMKMFGVNSPDLRQVSKELKGITSEWAWRDKILLIKKLVEVRVFECQQLAYVFISTNKNIWDFLTREDVIDLGQNMDNWATVDGYCMYVIGHAWRKGMFDDEYFKNLLKSEDVWQRRIAVVATIPLNSKAQGGSGDAKRTLEICKLVVEDYHDMIVKALSWALRELAKRDKDEVQNFIDRYDEVLHQKVLREVTNKLVFGKKNLGQRIRTNRNT